jgi:hypothetical protein
VRLTHLSNQTDQQTTTLRFKKATQMSKRKKKGRRKKERGKEEGEV